MSTQVQHRRGTTVQHDAFTGAMSEFTHDTTRNNIRVHDGQQAGGYATLMEHQLGAANGVASLDSSGSIPEAQLGNIPHSVFEAQANVEAANVKEDIHAIYLISGDAVGTYTDTDNGSTDTLTSDDGRTWYRVKDVDVDRISDDIFAFSSRLVTVGAGGDFSTINDAVKSLSHIGLREYVAGGFAVEVRLRSGFVWAEQILVANGLDLSFITITAEDAETAIDASAITVSLSLEDSLTPVIGAKYGARSPKLGCLLAYPDASLALDGVAAIYDASVAISPECGIKNARQAVSAFNGGIVSCFPRGLRAGALIEWGANFTGAYERAIHANHNGRVYLPRAHLDDCACNSVNEAVMCIWGGEVDLYQSSIQRSGGTGLLARDGGRIYARETNVADAATHGYQAYHGGYIDARYYETSPAGDGGCSGAGGYGVAVDTAGIIEASHMNAQNCGSTAFWAAGGGIITATDADGSGSNRGIYAQGASIVAASNTKLDNCTYRAIDAIGTACVSFDAGSAIGNLGDIAIRSDASASVDCRNATITGSAQSALYAYENGRISADGANVSNAGTYGAFASRGGSISAMNLNATGAGTYGVGVENGGIITCRSMTGTSGKAKNTLSVDGYILG